VHLAPADPEPAPATLRPPADISDLVGRDLIVDMLERLLTPADPADTAGPVVVLCGPPGVGKTAVATRVAHRLGGRFSGGAIFIPLRASAQRAAEPMEVFGRLLRAMGIAHDRVPPTLTERINWYRTWTSGRNYLIVLDDVADVRQAQSFLPGCSRSAVLMTSRAALYGCGGSTVVELDGLRPPHAVELLAAQLGRRRVGREPAATHRIVELCDRLPRALRSAAAQLAVEPGLSLDEFASVLTWSGMRPDQLAGGSCITRLPSDRGYDRLSAVEREALDRLERASASGFTAEDVASLLGCDVAAAESMIVRLLEQRCVRASADQTAGGRHYHLSPITRRYLREAITRSPAARIRHAQPL
jgi:DNA polymerase III delta prime subunit